MSREMRSVVLLIISLVTFVLLLPLTIIIAITKVLKGILNIVDKTLTFFIKTIREEIIQ